MKYAFTPEPAAGELQAGHKYSVEVVRVTQGPEDVVPTVWLRVVGEEEPTRCGKTAWPYTENNVCVLDPHTTGDHRDVRGRPFTHAGYVRTGE